MNQTNTPSHADLIRHWPSLKEFARDMALERGLIEQWVARDSIPGKYWAWVALCAHKRGLSDVTLERLSVAASFREIAA